MNRITHFKKRLLNTLMLLVFGFSFSQVLDQFNTPVPLSGGAFQLSSAPIHNAGQSFVCGITGDLSQVNIRVGDFTGAFVAGSFQLRIFSGNGYGGTVLNTTFFNVNTIPELNTYAEFAIPLSSLVPVTAGNSYTIDLRGITGTVQTNGTNQLYNNGGLYVNNGATFFYNTNDLWFKTFVVPAPAGASLSFDGSNDFVKVNDNPLLDFGSNDFTVEYWVYKKNANVYGGVSKWNTKLSPTTNEWGLLLNADGAGSNRPNFIIESGSTSYDCPASTNLNLNTWYHLAGVREGTNLKIYVNGILENTVPIGNITVNNSGRDLLIDRLLSGYFGGAIYDEIRIWNRALSACEIQYNKDAELANGQSGLVAYFKCNQGIANSDNSGLIDLIDETPNGFEGEITNFQLNGTTSNFVLPGSPASAVSGTLYNLLSVNITQEFCNAAQVSDLIATGSGTINWYDVATGGIPLSNTQNLVTGNYYVSQTTGTCESERTSVNVIINSTPIPVANANQTYDANATVASLVATGNNLKWYSLAEGGTELSSSTLLTSATYYVSQTNDGCESSRVLVNVTINGGSLHFDNSDDRVTLGTAINAVIDPINTITVEAWVYNTSFNNAFGFNLGSIIGNYNTSNVDMQFMMRRDGTAYQFWVNDSNGTNYKVISVPNLAVLNQWQHIAGVWNGADLKLYLNGVLVGTTTGVTGASFKSLLNNPIHIGTNLSNEKFTGNIDEIRIWSRALTAPEILNNMNCELGAPQIGLVAYYKFNQGFGNGNNTGLTTLTDASGNNYNGTLTNFTLNGNTSNWSNISAVTSGNTCSAFLNTNTFDETNLSIYPNPTSGIVNISYDKEITSVSVFNLLGQNVLNQKGNGLDMQLDLSTLSSATYFVKITSEGATKTIKVVKQ